MQPMASEVSTCPSCGRTLEETSGGGLGCMFCLLRVGIGGEDNDPHRPLSGLASTASEDETRFGVYEIERRPDGSLYQLGHGAMGVTYRAIDTTLQRRVALKVIRPAIAARSAEARERFLREARAAAALRHKHIATIFQFGIREESGQCFYAMELIEGETLEERVRRAGPLDVRTTIEIAQQIASALAAAEKRGLIHRDLKPANLMLVNPDDAEEVGTSDCVIPTIKIIDFGLAKALNGPVDPMRLTHGGFIGTPAFASPEQFEDAALDARADIYSLGATLWFALTGKTPFSGHSVEEIHRAKQADALPAEQLKAAHVPHRLRSLLRSMLAVEPAARPTMRDLAARLERCAAEASGMRHTRIVLAAVFILVLGVFAFFIFPLLRIHPPFAGSTADRGHMTSPIRTTIPSALPVKTDPANWAQKNDTPVAPEIWEEVVVPTPLEHYSVAQASTKTEKQASHRKKHVARSRPNLFKKLVAGFIKLQKRHPAKSSRKTQVQPGGAAK
jgi:serine/threonine protein kinase